MTLHKLSLVFVILLCASPYLLRADNLYSTTVSGWLHVVMFGSKAVASPRYTGLDSFLGVT